MSPRRKRRDRRDWRSGPRYKVVLTVGWIFLVAAVALLVTYFVAGYGEALVGAVATAGVAVVAAGTRPELERRRPRRIIFSPWQGDAEPSLARQLLTLP